MAYFQVHTTIDGPKYRTFGVEADSEEAAKRKANHVDGTLISRNHDSHGYIDAVNDVKEVSRPETKPFYEVMGVYTDTDDLQPFTYEVRANSPREALVKAIGRAEGISGREELASYAETHVDHDLVGKAVSASIRPVSVRSQVRPTEERLHDIEEYQ